jgi:hypothetical protein
VQFFQNANLINIYTNIYTNKELYVLIQI